MIAARKIGAADRALENHVAHYRDPVQRVKEDHVARRMTWAMSHLECLFTKFDRVTFV